MAKSAKKVFVIGLDGMEPSIVEPMLDRGELPHLASLRAQGGYSRCRTTFPAQTPVAWSSFATGVNPGGHGIFDFIRRDPATYLPDLALNRYEQKSAFLPPKAVNLRRGKPMWSVLTAAGVPSVVLRCPCTYPPDEIKGRLLGGMGVPDIRGGLGTATFYSSAADVKPGESESVVHITPDSSGKISTDLAGPRNPKTRSDATVALTFEIDRSGGKAILHSDGQPRTVELRQGEWSEWVHLKFKLGMLQSVSGMARFLLVRTEPDVEIYASPVNFEAGSPMFPISHPWEYARELEKEIGTYYTTGMVEDHTGLSNERFGESEYLDQCTQVLRERERMLMFELDRVREGLVFCLFDTPDRLAHMFWRFREPSHPANNGSDGSEWARAIESHYRDLDAIVGRVLEHADPDTLVIVLSDHGFNSFQRGVHLNTWLYDNGFLALENGMKPGEEAGDFFRHVDWGNSKAYALGLGSIYLNVRGRESQGIVKPDDASAVARDIARGLGGLRDEARGAIAVNKVVAREEIYNGAFAAESPDLIACFGSGYRVSWATALGGMPHGHLEDNIKRWGGDHIIDPALVPGVLFMNRNFRNENASLLDLAPTILEALGVPADAAMEGRSLMPAA
jgi:predicted AlkP superfamily phosphohydrolase/phosphomutase